METGIQGENGSVGSEVLVQDAYERVKVDFAGLKADELLAVNLDIPAAVSTVLGVLPEVRALRERIVKELPSFDIGSFDKLEDYALALSFAQTNYLTATQPPDDLIALAADAIKMRDRLSADATALAQHALVDSGQLEQLRGGNGYKNLAQDLQILSHVLQEAWPKTQGKSPTTTDDLQLANRMSTRLMRIVGLREQGPALLAAATDVRLRAFTLLLRVYEDARRATGYLRAREGDADSIAPSLFPGRPRRRQTQTEPAQPSDAPTPTSGPASPATGSVTTTGIPAVNAGASAGSVAKTPNKDPFIS